MPLRFGEMVLMVRTQDFASRNLHQISGELGKMSRAQRLLRNAEEARGRAEMARSRVDTLSRERQRLKLVNQSIRIQDALAAAATNRARSEKALATQRAHLKDADPATATRLQRTMAATTKRAERAERHYKRIQSLAGAIDSQFQRLPNRFKRLINDQGQLNDRLDDNAEKLKTARMQYKLYGEDAVRAEQAASRSALKAVRRSQAGHAMGRFGRVAQLTGIATTAAIGFSASRAAELNTQLTRAATQAVTGSEASLAGVAEKTQKFSDVVIDAMGRFPASSNEMSDALYNIFSSLDVTEQKGLELFDTFNKLAVAGGIDLPTAVNAGISVIESFKGAGNDLDDTLNRVMAIVRFGRLDLAGFNTMLAKVGPAAAGAGQSLRDVSGAMAFLATTGISPAKGSTQLSRLIQVFSDPDFIVGMQKAGVEITDANGQLISLDKIIEKIAKRFPELTRGQGVRTFFQVMTALGRGGGRGREFTIEAQRGFTSLITKIDRYRQLQHDINADTSEFDRAQAAMAQSQGVRWKVFMNNLKRAGLALGESVIPVFSKVGTVIGNLVDSWNQLDPGTKRVIGSIAGLTAAFSLLIGITASLAGFFLSMSGMLLSATIGASKAAAALRILSASLKGLMAIGVIVIGIQLVKKSGTGWDWFDKWAGFGPKGRKAHKDKDLNNMLKTFKELDDIYADSTPQRYEERWKKVGQMSRADFQFLEQHAYALSEERIALLKAAKAYNIYYNAKDKDKAAKKQFGIPKIGEDVVRAANDHKKAFDNMTSDLDKFEKNYRKNIDNHRKQVKDRIQMERQLARAIREAQQQAQDSIRRAAENIAQTYEGLRDANKQAMGDLFAGPLLTSPAFDLAQEWGITPKAKDINNDLAQANKVFKTWRTAIGKLRKKLGPELADVANEFQAQGPEKIGFIESVLAGSPEQFAEFRKFLRERKAMIEKATTVDFNRTRDAWFKYGKSAAEQIVLGLSDPHDGLTAKFESWINTTFPTIIARAKAQAQREFELNNGKIPPSPPVPLAVPASWLHGNPGTRGTAGRPSNDPPITIEHHYHGPYNQGDAADAQRRTAWAVRNRGKKR